MIMNSKMLLVFLGVFFIIEAVFSALYYSKLDLPLILRIIRIVFGIILIGLGTRNLPTEQIPLYLFIALLCLISLFSGYILGVIFPWRVSVG